ncbi:MAG: mannose-1-phosphate guanylyltransferase, partial [Phycisphaerae bacterium]|nr:mannose-1-phosphate guanylyltransferase [Phycisphaerae bacterium]
HAVIMAGGSGTRLWPLSREDRPKQLLKLFGGKSLLRLSYERLASLLPPSQLYVITSQQHLSVIASELPELPAENLFGEPCPRDTAPAVGLAAHLIAQRDPDGVMGIFTADHVIDPIDAFCDSLTTAFNAAEQHSDALVTFGVKPTSPHTGYGYIHRGQSLDEGSKGEQGSRVYEVRGFKEKPDLLNAGIYVASGEYYWNAGMFVWKIPTILAQYEKHQPEMNRKLQAVAADFSNPSRVDTALEMFSSVQKISVDFAIMEKADRVICVEMAARWLDVGSWPSLAEIFPPDANGNTIVAPRTATLDSRNNILVSEMPHLIATVGLEDIIVVHSPEATLVCRRNEAQRIKDLLPLIKPQQ